MKFIDEAKITVESGCGGKGCISFRREKYIPYGGPDGGDGGKGGDVILLSTNRKRTLYHFKFKRQFKALNGRPGQGNQRSGKNGEDIIIEVPPGALVTDLGSGGVIKDFDKPDERFVVARGGRGGKGNAHFKTSTHQTPRFAQPGEPGEKLDLKIELKLLADVGIIGLPNAGKSTLIRAISSAKPKIGNYPFTTLSPNLGVVKTSWGEPFVVADIPGLIEGAHLGAGLGTKFLRHIERTRMLIHLIDASQIDATDPLRDFRTVNQELVLYDEKLAEKPQIIVLNKMDISGCKESADYFEATASDKAVLRISAVTGDGIKPMLSEIIQILDRSHV